MKELRYSCDCGALKIGDENFSTLFRNGLGDGEFDLYIVETSKERQHIEANYRFVTSITTREIWQ